MQIGKDKALRLLIVDDSVEAAEAIVSGLRNAGIAVRPTRPENEDELKELLDSQTPDLIIAAHASRAVPLARTMALVVATGKDLPVLVLYDSIDDARLLEASAMGARGTILRDRAAQIEYVVRSEWTDLEARRALRRPSPAACAQTDPTPRFDVGARGLVWREGLAQWAPLRQFRDELGMGFQRWRQQVVLAHALPMLARGTPVGQVAAASGYASDSAFTAMFRSALGQPPTRFGPGAAA